MEEGDAGLKLVSSVIVAVVVADADASGIPMAILKYEVKNTSNEDIEVSISKKEPKLQQTPFVWGITSLLQKYNARRQCHYSFQMTIILWFF